MTWLLQKKLHKHFSYETTNNKFETLLFHFTLNMHNIFEVYILHIPQQRTGYYLLSYILFPWIDACIHGAQNPRKEICQILLFLWLGFDCSISYTRWPGCANGARSQLEGMLVGDVAGNIMQWQIVVQIVEWLISGLQKHLYIGSLTVYLGILVWLWSSECVNVRISTNKQCVIVP